MRFKDMRCPNPRRRLQKWGQCVLYYYHFLRNMGRIGFRRCKQAVKCFRLDFNLFRVSNTFRFTPSTNDMSKYSYHHYTY